MNGLMMKYFVLKPGGDDVYARASRAAMMTYAAIIYGDNPTFTQDIEQWVTSAATESHERQRR